MGQGGHGALLTTNYTSKNILNSECCKNKVTVSWVWPVTHSLTSSGFIHVVGNGWIFFFMTGSSISCPHFYVGSKIITLREVENRVVVARDSGEGQVGEND